MILTLKNHSLHNLKGTVHRNSGFDSGCKLSPQPIHQISWKSHGVTEARGKAMPCYSAEELVSHTCYSTCCSLKGKSWGTAAKVKFENATELESFKLDCSASQEECRLEAYTGSQVTALHGKRAVCHGKVSPATSGEVEICKPTVH